MKKRQSISEEERDLFRTQIGKVQPLRQDKLPAPPPVKPRKIRRQSPIAPEALDLPLPSLNAALLDPVQAGDVLFFSRPGLQRREIQKMRTGEINIEAKLDLHGLNIDQAHIALHQFLNHALLSGYRYILIIHGKGSRGDNATPKLKNRVNFWLREYSAVLAFCSTKPAHGGTGAVYVRLKTKDQLPIDNNYLS